MIQFKSRWGISAVLCLGFMHLGCSVEADGAEEGQPGNQLGDQELGELQAQLLGGTTTNVRPAIGKLSMGCTGTLVDANYVITAAHCVDGVSGPRNDTFTIRDTTGKEAAKVKVDRSYAYGANTTSASTDDIAFVHLATPVASATAAPIAIGSAPATNASVAAFGFGCTNRSTGAGGGSKQFVDYTFGASALNCPGDSGGPRVHGSHTGSGSIWGINSGYFSKDGVDIVADAASIAPPILRSLKAAGATSVTNAAVASFPGWAAEAGVKAVAGDFNADGRGDVALVGGANWSSVPVAFGDGAGGYSVKNTALANFPGWAKAARSVVAGDFDADGRTDIALVGGSGWNTIPIAFSKGDGSFTVTNLSTPNLPAWSQVMGAYAVAGDFDADGDADLALVGGSNWNTVPMGFSNRNGTFSQTNTVVSNIPGWSRVSGARAVVADFDADGDADIALSGGTGWGSIPVAFSNRVGGFSVTNKSVSNFPSWVLASGVKFVAGDFDGDGDGDIAAVGGSGWRTTALAFSDRTGGFTDGNLPMANFPGWANSARYALAVRANSGATTDIVLTGGAGWGSVPTAFFAK